MISGRFTQLPSRQKLYICVVGAAGATAVLCSVYELALGTTPWSWTILAALTLISGSATIKLPSLPATITVSETFVFSSVLLFGPAAATLTVALDALVISFWSYKKGHPVYKIVFNLFALPLTIWLSSQLFFFQTGIEPLFHSGAVAGPLAINRLLFPLFVLALTYFSLNSWIITFAISLEKGLRPYRVWRDNFAWLSLNYFGGASVAALLISYTRDLSYAYIALILPLIVVLYFTFSTAMGRVGDANRHLKELNELYMSTIETLAMAVDAKDQVTHGHIRRVQTYAVRLAKLMGITDAALIRAIETAALLHDMGKLAVPEYILNKPGPLTAAEFKKMKLHAAVGADMLAAIDFPYPVVPIVRHHHENWNGTGYPDGLAGVDIPIGARILSVVDCFDALTSDRPYRSRLSDSEATEILLERRGSMYDPLVVDAFVASHSQIGTTHSDSARDPTATTPEIMIVGQTERSVLTTYNSADTAAGAREVLALMDLASSLPKGVTVSDAGDIVAKHLNRLVPHSLCVFYLYQIDSDELVAAHSAGDDAGLVAGLRIPVGQRLSGWVAAHRQTIRNSNPSLDFGGSNGEGFALGSCLSTPMISNGALVGVLSLYSQRHETFTDEGQRILEAVSGEIAQILGLAVQAERYVGEALRDHATGLPNTTRLRQVTQTPLRDRGLLALPASALLVRVGYLDHAAAVENESLRSALFASVVDAALCSLRAGDLLFRSGGYELVALLLNTDGDTSHSIATRLRDTLREAALVREGESNMS